MAPAILLWKTLVHQDRVHRCRLLFLHPLGPAEPVPEEKEEIGKYQEGILKVALLKKQPLV